MVEEYLDVTAGLYPCLSGEFAKVAVTDANLSSSSRFFGSGN
jgi:hypothetical protein